MAAAGGRAVRGPEARGGVEESRAGFSPSSRCFDGGGSQLSGGPPCPEAGLSIGMHPGGGCFS